MAILYSFLNEKISPQIYEAFLEAFSDYIVDMSYMNEKSFLNRSIKNGIDFSSSVGVFENEKMVGYTLIGIDRFKNYRSAFDIGTGIIKDYRGRGIAREMFNFALPKLKEKGVEKFVLEVIQENEAAVKAYKKSGFEITREFDCFQLEFKKFKFREISKNKLIIQSIGKDNINEFKRFLDWEPSWENSFASIMRIPDEILLFEAVYKEESSGFLAYYPALNWIMSIAVKKEERMKGIGYNLINYLVKQIRNKIDFLNLINVESSDKAMIKFLKNSGFELYGKQYEMELQI